LPWADESKPFGLDFKSFGLDFKSFGLSSLSIKTCKNNIPFVIRRPALELDEFLLRQAIRKPL
jgi:hypothetical protein